MVLRLAISCVPPSRTRNERSAGRLYAGLGSVPGRESQRHHGRRPLGGDGGFLGTYARGQRCLLKETPNVEGDGATAMGRARRAVASAVTALSNARGAGLSVPKSCDHTRLERW
jgi:hypothetical protein